MRLATFLFLACTALAAAAAEPGMPAPNWNREAALAAQDPAAVAQTLEQLFQLARERRSAALLEEVNRIADDPAVPAPERDRVLQQLAAALGDFPPGQVDAAILERLAATRALVRVPHEESPGVGVPLYNIRAAASGSLAQWQRAAKPETTLGDKAPAELITSLSQPGPGQLERIRRARAELAAGDLEALLFAAASLEDATTAALWVAELAPAVIDRPAVGDFLMGLLDDPHLGGTAALALAASHDTHLLDELATLADEGSGLAAQRAALALQARLREEAPR